MPDYQNNIDELNSLSDLEFENIFKLYKDDKFFFYNILKTVNLPIALDPTFYYTYRVKASMPYTALSYKLYNTQKLWWLICIANNINNPFEFITPGTTIKVIRSELISELLSIIKSELK